MTLWTVKSQFDYLLSLKNVRAKWMLSKTLSIWKIIIRNKSTQTPVTKQTKTEFVYSQNVLASNNANMTFKHTFERGRRNPINNRRFRRWFGMKPMDVKHFSAYWRVNIFLYFINICGILFSWIVWIINNGIEYFFKFDLIFILVFNFHGFRLLKNIWNCDLLLACSHINVKLSKYLFCHHSVRYPNKYCDCQHFNFTAVEKNVRSFSIQIATTKQKYFQ